MSERICAWFRLVDKQAELDSIKFSFGYEIMRFCTSLMEHIYPGKQQEGRDQKACCH